jgi:UDP-glucose 4-epimerase
MILITGAAGYVGTALSYIISKMEKFADHEIRLVDNFLIGSEKNFSQLRDVTKKSRSKFEFVEGDITNPNTVKEVMQDVNEVIHLAADPGIKSCQEDPLTTWLTNVEATRLLLEASDDVRRFIFPSSVAVYGEPKEDIIKETSPIAPINNYGIQKVAAENYCMCFFRERGIPVTILRKTNVYGVGFGGVKWRTVIPNFVRMGLEQGVLPIYGTGKQKRDFLHIRDAVNAYLLMLTTNHDIKGKIFNVGAGEVSVLEIAEMVTELIEKEAGKRVKIKFVQTDRVEPSASKYKFSFEKIKRLGYRPKVSLQNGIKEIIDICRE